MERCSLPDSAELEWANARLAPLRRQGPSDRTLERRARALGDAVRRGLPLPRDYQEFCRNMAKGPPATPDALPKRPWPSGT